MIKKAQQLNDKYKAIQLDLYGMEGDNERILSEVQFQLDSLQYGQSMTVEELEEEGYSEKQISRMVNTAIKRLQGFLKQYNY